MRDHELELIAALVEGRLDDETEARALVSSSPELREEYEAQKLAYEALQGADPVGLTESERSELHRDIWTGLRPHPDIAPGRTTPWYHRWVPVAAGLLLLIGVATVFYPGGQDSGDLTDLAADAPTEGAETTIAAAEAAGDGDQAEADGGEATNTTASSREEAAAPLSDEAAAVYSREAEMMRQGMFSSRLQSYEESGAMNAALERCIEEAGLSGHRILATLAPPAEDTSTTAGEAAQLAVAVPEDADLATAPIAFVDLDTCEVVYTDE